jgi:hypothetical protein
MSRNGIALYLTLLARGFPRWMADVYVECFDADGSPLIHNGVEW